MDDKTKKGFKEIEMDIEMTLGSYTERVKSRDANASQNSLNHHHLNTKVHKLFREFAIATLSSVVESKKQTSASSDAQPQISALDAYTGSGVAALQWKSLLKEKVHVMAAGHRDNSLHQQNAVRNSIECSTWVLDVSRIPGDPREHQPSHAIASCAADAKCVLMMESFNFVYLNPHKASGTYLEPAFHSLNGGGILCLVVTDLSVFARAQHVVRRAFSAQVIKTEYMKEMAARVVLGEAARSAAKFNKGILVLSVVSQEDFLLLTVRVCRGQKAVDSSLDNVAHLLHCRICEERSFLPNQLAPLDDPYQYLQCGCKSQKSGKTAVIIGPMWRGPIFNTDFLEQISLQSKKLGLSPKLCEIVQLMKTEGQCPSSDEETRQLSLADSVIKPSADDTNKEQSREDKQPSISPGLLSKPADKNSLLSEHSEVGLEVTSSLKRKGELEPYECCVKQAKMETTEGTREHNVPFYQNIRKFKKTITLKLNKLVSILHAKGYRASRTHFDPCAIRTTANVHQFMEIMN